MLFAQSCAHSAADVLLRRNGWAVRVQPDTLKVVAQLDGRPPVRISEPQERIGPASALKQDGVSARWRLDGKVSVSMRMRPGGLAVDIRSDEPGSFTWPAMSFAKPARALIWPRWEGCYIPLDDARWADYLVDYGEWDTLEGLTMPFWGLDCGPFSATYIVTNPCNNRIRFKRSGDQLAASLTHDFTPNNPDRRYGLLISLSDAASPVEPARRFRDYLISSGQFVSMRQKLQTVPNAERLLGAAHVYLWGDGLITRHDILPAQWAPLCRKLSQDAAASTPSVGRRLKALMDDEGWAAVLTIAGADWPDKYTKSQVAAALSAVLRRTDFYDGQSWQGIALPPEADALMQRGCRSLLLPELCRLNGLLLGAAYPGMMLDVKDWGDGVSLKMLRGLRQAGFDRARLCVEGWSGVEMRPEVAAEASRMGYLFGTYDSYHSIHSPDLRGSSATWETAQFDRKLYESGPIVGRDGTKLRGFKRTGYLLSPIAARPYVEKRVRDNFARVPYTYYFVDCDAFGQVFDDYSPLHPATQAQDIAARNARLRWIGDTFRAVVGSEGGSACAAPAVHLVEGVFAPDMGWGDPDLKDPKSPYFPGAYYPPDGPRVFLQQVPLKEQYSYFFFDPRFRLPLYETVFHDSVVSGHHWSSGSLKYSNVLTTNALTEILYQVPPMYHLNLDELEKHGGVMKKQYAFFSPLHRELGFQKLSAFEWVREDRLVQRTTFGDSVEITANFSDSAYAEAGKMVPPRSAMARWLKTGRTQVFTPAAAE